MICTNHAETTEQVRRCARCTRPFCHDCLVDSGGHSYCAGCKSEYLLDVLSGVDRTRLELAGPWKRFGAIFLDGLLIYLPLYFGWMFLSFAVSSKPGEPHPMLAFIFVPLILGQFLYEGLMLSMKSGQTLGKLAVKVQVVRPDGRPISSGQAWGRATMKLLFGCLCFIDYVPAFFTEQKTTLHDMVAGTRVIETY